MGTSKPSEEHLLDPDAQIAWVLAHPTMSPWLKDALRTALDQDPIHVLNDLEVLRHVLNARCEASISAYLSPLNALSDLKADGEDHKRR